MVRLVRQGLVAFRLNVQLWPYLYLTKFGLALLVSIPALVAAQSALDNTLYSAPLLKEWSLKVIGELIAQRPFVFGSAFIVLAIFSFLVLLIRQFLNGGIYLAYARGRRITRVEFFAAAGERFGTHLRITGIMVIVYLLAGGIGIWLGSAVGSAIGTIFPQADLLSLAVSLGVLGLVLTPVVAFSDSMRAVSVRSGTESTKTLLTDTFAFYRLHWVKMVALYVILFGVFAMVWAIIEKAALVVTGGLENKIGIVIELLLFQFCSFLRTGQSLVFTASVVSGYQQTNPVMPERYNVEVPVD